MHETAAERGRTVPLTYREVAEILKIIDASTLDEISIELDGAKIHVRRTGNGGPPHPLPAMTMPAPSSLGTAAARVSQGPWRPSSVPPASPSQHSVRAPTMGSFYRAPSPQDPPFVEVGSVVKRGDPLCLIEVMKLFTTISADQDGRIAHILAADGELVEFDQILFVIEPT
jgi:acetyl-CoA carboxylase biotin carboxyl carrier protein